MRVEALISPVLDQIIGYLPSLFGGLLLFFIGVLAGWFTKRVVVQILLILRLHRLILGFRWARGLRRVDVRLSLYQLIGNLIGFIVFLVFLNSAFITMKLPVVSTMIEKFVLVFPRIATSLLIFGLGWWLSVWATNAMRRALFREGVPRAGLIASYARAMLLVFFGAMALSELDIAPQIVLIGFSVVFVTLGAIAIGVTIFRARALVRRIFAAGDLQQMEAPEQWKAQGRA